MKISKETLKELYCDKEFSTPQIAESLNVGKSTVCFLLKKYNISPRSRGDGIFLRLKNNCKLDDKAKEFINGELLGDACLESRNNRSARFQYGSKYEEYIRYLSDTLSSFGIKQSGNIRYRQNRSFISFSYSSKSYVELFDIYTQL